jgi:small subunit ribosomal protein S9
MATVDKKNYYYALGRRKSSTARVRLMNGKGVFTINKKPVNEYFSSSKSLMHEIMKPFSAIEMESSKYDITAVVSGGGITGQVEAVRLGVSKALALMNEDLKATLRRAELLGRDPREKERKKFGLKGARKQRQFTKR